jgi:hypothetical protein
MTTIAGGIVNRPGGGPDIAAAPADVRKPGDG